MHPNRKILLPIILIMLSLFLSCGPSRNITYLSNLGNAAETTSRVEQQTSLSIQPGDLLSILVTSLSVESNVLFNSSSVNGVPEYAGYLVDENGFIDFPIIGPVKVAGHNKTEARELLITKLNEHVKKPIVNIRFLNFKVTVLGEVNNPSSFVIPSDRVNIFEALGLAGDMTVYGKRENVLLIREKGNLRTTVRLNLNDKEILNSPYFYLQQNDIIYIEPDESRAAQANIRRSNFQFGLSITTAIISILTLILTRVL